MDRIERDKEHVALSVAAAIAYHQVTGATGDIVDAADLDALLNRAARALASVTEIYARDGAAARPIPASELVGGAFMRGATIFKSADGRMRTHLSLPRGAMREAIAILRAAAPTNGLFRRP